MLPTLLVTTLVFGLRTDPGRLLMWEADIVKIEKRLHDQPPKPGGIFFAGSSMIRLWKLNNNFPDWQATNVGFGGSETRQVTHFANRIIVPHAPKTVVFYCGDNDINSGRTDAQVLRDFRAFVWAIHAKLPRTRILCLAVKPSPKRWHLFDVQQRANTALQAYCDDDPRLTFVNIVPAILGTDGRPRAELFVNDGLHFTDAGYAAWAPLVRQAVEGKR
jgi:lysophospholipase L1-like esterase